MTKLAIFLILSLGLTVVGRIQAQAKNEVYIFTSMSECAVAGVPEAYVQSEFKERPFTQSSIVLQSAKNGRLYQGKLVTFVNPQTRTYTLIVQFEDGYSCILGTGGDFEPANQGTNL